jgi:quercetin dioxygenase-like cupin family protein
MRKREAHENLLCPVYCLNLKHHRGWRSFTFSGTTVNTAKKGNGTMKKVNLYDANDFSDQAFKRLLVHDSPYFKILNFNFKAGQELPVHSHDIEGQLSLVVIEGEGEFMGKDGVSSPAKAGDVLISDISEPHGLKAKTDLRLLVTIAPPI